MRMSPPTSPHVLKVLGIPPANPGNPGWGGPTAAPTPIPHPRPGTRRLAGQHVCLGLPHQLLGLPHVAHSVGRGRRGCPGAWDPILLLSLSPRRPLNRAASAFSQTPLLAAALCSCCRADKRGKWSKPTARQETTALCVSNFGGWGGGTVQGDVTPAGISKAEETGHPATACTLPPGLAASRGQAWGEGERAEAPHKLLLEWVSSDFSNRIRWLGLGLGG